MTAAVTARRTSPIGTSDLNPYQPGHQEPISTGDGSRPLIRHLFYAINFSVAVLVFVSTLISIAVMESPGSFFGGMIGFLPVLIYGIAEWVAWYRRRRSTERKLAYANLACATFVAFGVVTTIGEVFADSEPIEWRFLTVFTFIGLCIMAYLTVCGWLRLRWTRRATVSP